MPLIVDGHNLLLAGGPSPIGPDEAAHDEAREQLIERLARHQNSCGEAVTVVFDSRRGRGGARSESMVRGVRVLYAHPPRTADDEIRHLVIDATDPRNLRVVTSDRDLARACAHRGASVVRSEAFQRGLAARDAALHDDEREFLEKNQAPTDDEMRDLLDAFGGAEDDVWW